MQDTSTNRLVTGEDMEHLHRLVPPGHRGPVFKVGELIPIRGYYYRVEELSPDRLTFAPHGPVKTERVKPRRRRGQK